MISGTVILSLYILATNPLLIYTIGKFTFKFICKKKKHI